MATPLEGAVLGWLVASGGDTVRDKLRLAPAAKAMRKAVEDAAAAAVAEVAGHLDDHQAGQLRAALLVRDVGFDADGVQVSNEVELREALHSWVAALDVPEFDEPGYLSKLRVDQLRIAEVFAQQVVAGIQRNARAGGPLNPLAEWIWRDDTTFRLARIETMVGAAIQVSGPAGGRLPGGTPDFTGRAEVLAQLYQWVQAHDPDGVVVAVFAVVGMAGVGKTELALRAAHQHKHRYPDGQYFINLHGYTPGVEPMQPVVVLEELLRQAGVPAQAIPPDLAGRQARWQALMAGRKALVLLDNALDADQVRPVLPNSSGCLVLVTSRTRLTEVSGVQILPLEVLSPDEAVELFCRVADSSAADLDHEGVATVVELVGRLPVALRAVAAQVGDGYTVAELVTDLSEAKQRLELTGADGPLGARMTAALDTTVQRLQPPQQYAYRILGIYPGPTIGVPQFAALAGLSVPQAAATLRRLAERNLLTPVEDRLGHRRWQLHDLLRYHSRHHARSRISPEEESAGLARLTTWYSAALDLVEYLLDTNGDEPPVAEGLKLSRALHAWAWVAAEQESLLGYAEQATDQEAADLCHRYAHRLYLLDHHRAAQVLHRMAASIFQESGDQRRYATAQLGLGHVARKTGDHEAAREHYLAALCTVEQTGDKGERAGALLGLGHVAIVSSQYVAARQSYQAASGIFKELGDQHGYASALIGLGMVAQALEAFHAASTYFEAALDVSQRHGDQTGQASALFGLGHVAVAFGQNSTALAHFQTVLGIYREVGDWNGYAESMLGLGKVELASGDSLAARGHFQAALDTYQDVGDPDGQANALSGLGFVAEAEGRHDDARSCWQAALVLVSADVTLADVLREKLGSVEASS